MCEGCEVKPATSHGGKRHLNLLPRADASECWKVLSRGQVGRPGTACHPYSSPAFCLLGIRPAELLNSLYKDTCESIVCKWEKLEPTQVTIKRKLIKEILVCSNSECHQIIK